MRYRRTSLTLASLALLPFVYGPGGVRDVLADEPASVNDPAFFFAELFDAVWSLEHDETLILALDGDAADDTGDGLGNVQVIDTDAELVIDDGIFVEYDRISLPVQTELFSLDLVAGTLTGPTDVSLPIVAAVVTVQLEDTVADVLVPYTVTDTVAHAITVVHVLASRLRPVAAATNPGSNNNDEHNTDVEPPDPPNFVQCWSQWDDCADDCESDFWARMLICSGAAAGNMIPVFLGCISQGKPPELRAALVAGGAAVQFGICALLFTTARARCMIRCERALNQCLPRTPTTPTTPGPRDIEPWLDLPSWAL